MLVSDINLFNPARIRLRITSTEGVELTMDVRQDMTVDGLKLQAAAHLFDPSESVKTSLYHKLFHVKRGRVLSETKTLTQESVKDNDELLLLKRRVPPPHFGTEKKDLSEKSPTKEKIKQATANIPAIHTDRTVSGASPSVDFQTELRKILISLIDAAQRLLCLNPEAAKLFSTAEKYIKEETSDSVVVDPDSLKQLKDMGFSEKRATKALVLNRMSTEDAIQWLIEHEADVDGDQSAAESTDTKDAAKAEQAQANTDSDTMQDSDSVELGAFSRELATLSGPNKVQQMLQSFRAYRRKEFKPNPRALKTLVEMGFDEQDSIDALRLHANSQEEACDYLLSGKSQNHAGSIDLEERLDPESSVYKAIMSNPTIQLGLGNPRSLIAFLHMLENPSNTQQWLNDPDTGPMLIQISRIYQAEKNQQS